MKEITGIELVLENCQTICLKPEQIGRINISNIEKGVCRLGLNSIVTIDEAGLVMLEIFNTLPKETVALLDNTPITSISITDEDGNITDYYTDYEPIDLSVGSWNKNQKTIISSLGHIYIVITNSEDLEYVMSNFMTKECNNEEYMSNFISCIQR